MKENHERFADAVRSTFRGSNRLVPTRELCGFWTEDEKTPCCGISGVFLAAKSLKIVPDFNDATEFVGTEFELCWDFLGGFICGWDDAKTRRDDAEWKAGYELGQTLAVELIDEPRALAEFRG